MNNNDKKEVETILSDRNFWFDMQCQLTNLYSPLTQYDTCYHVIVDCPEVIKLKGEKVSNE
jgi:hypothetical protein